MSDPQTSAYDAGDGADGADAPDYDGDHTAPIVADATTTVVDNADYDDEEPIKDYVVDLVVNENPEGATLAPEFLNAVITDENGRILGYKTTLYDTINDQVTKAYDELNGNGTAITGNKGLFGWSTLKLILVGLAVLCLLAIILGILFFVFGKKFKKNKRPTATGTTTTTKAVVTKGISPDPKYSPVPNV